MNDILGFSLVQWYGMVLMLMGLLTYYVIGANLFGFFRRLCRLFGTLLTWAGLILYLMEHINRSH